MNLTSLLDRIIGVTPVAVDDSKDQSKEIREANLEVSELDHDIYALDVAVSIAETRLRSRGWLPE